LVWVLLYLFRKNRTASCYSVASYRFGSSLLRIKKGGNVSTVNIFLRVYPEKREEFLQTLRSMQGNLKEEQGLSKSSLYGDMDDPNVFHFIEEWATLDAMERYIRSERFSVLIGVLKVLCTESEVKYHLTSGKLGAVVSQV
jgi:quinol monooxygenase YgiN